MLSSAPTPEENVTFVLFTDNPPVGDTGVWGLRPLTWNHAICPRRSARYHKCMTHKVLPEHDYSVWVDGSQIFKGIKVWEDLLRPQVDVYHGMVETACVIRANTSAIHAFNSAWWSEISSDSFRDQLSFNYTCWTLQQEYGQIPGHREKSPFFNFVSHKR